MIPQVEVADKLGQFPVLLVDTGRSGLAVALGTAVEKMQVGKAVGPGTVLLPDGVGEGSLVEVSLLAVDARVKGRVRVPRGSLVVVAVTSSVLLAGLRGRRVLPVLRVPVLAAVWTGRCAVVLHEVLLVGVHPRLVRRCRAHGTHRGYVRRLL